MGSVSNTATTILDVPFWFDPLQPPRPFSSLVQIDFGALTHAGKVRTVNEDAYIIYRTARSWENLQTSLEAEDLPPRFDEHAYGMAVADGIGGAAGGQIASRMAIRFLISLILNAAKWAMK